MNVVVIVRPASTPRISMIFRFSFLSVKFAADDIDYIPDNTIYAFGNCPSYLIADVASTIFYQPMMRKNISWRRLLAWEQNHLCLDLI
jgi:hypothetical protein